MGRRGRKEGSRQNKSSVLRSASVLEADVLYPNGNENSFTIVKKSRLSPAILCTSERC